MIIGNRKFSYFDFGPLTLGWNASQDSTIIGKVHVFCNSYEEARDICKVLEKHQIPFVTTEGDSDRGQRVYFSPSKIKPGDIFIISPTSKITLPQTYIKVKTLMKALKDLRGQGYKTIYAINNLNYVIC